MSQHLQPSMIKTTITLLHECNKSSPTIPQLVADQQRFAQFSYECKGLLFDASRTQVTTQAKHLLLQLAQESRLQKAITALFDAQAVNVSENRPALHMALRAENPASFLEAKVAQEVVTSRIQLLEWVKAFQAGYLPGNPQARVKDIIHIGIGGSDLGSRMLAHALPNSDCQPNLHFISAPDSISWQQIAAQVDASTCAIIITTKSFSTAETLALAAVAKKWMGASFAKRSFAVTAARAKAEQWVKAEHILPMWPWVGGRFSVWSSAGIMGAIAIGADAFSELLQGAAEMDKHFRSQPIANNMPVTMALYDFWHHNIQDYSTRGVFVYDQRLLLVPEWLKQLEMESLGKQVQYNGQPVEQQTVPMIVGGSGPDAQHAIYQALHQGTRPWPMEFVTVAQTTKEHQTLSRLQWASMLAQAQALTHGNQSNSDTAQHLPGQRPVISWLLKSLTPRHFGAWLAAYEHKVYALASLWGINAFDQWGVEEGKRIAQTLLNAKQTETINIDPTTRQWLDRLSWWKKDA